MFKYCGFSFYTAFTARLTWLGAIIMASAKPTFLTSDRIKSKLVIKTLTRPGPQQHAKKLKSLFQTTTTTLYTSAIQQQQPWLLNVF
jgi:hypothetical protein